MRAADTGLGPSPAQRAAYREYLECLGIAFRADASFDEEYPQAASEDTREFRRIVRVGAARLYLGRRAHERAGAVPVEEPSLFPAGRAVAS